MSLRHHRYAACVGQPRISAVDGVALQPDGKQASVMGGDRVNLDVATDEHRLGRLRP
ncbi:MAG: hypothetical protein ABI899_08905 [Actinomycetota bacterium]